MPRGINDERTLATLRSHDEKLASLRFLFDSYRAKMYHWVRQTMHAAPFLQLHLLFVPNLASKQEAIEMYRVILLVGILPLIARTNLVRGAVGLAFSLLSMILHREISRFTMPLTNAIAYVAQVVIFLTSACCVLIETELSNQVDGFVFGSALLGVPFSELDEKPAFRVKIERSFLRA